MKTKIFAFITLTILLCLPSCTALLAPEHAEDDDILCYVYDKVHYAEIVSDPLYVFNTFAGAKYSTADTDEEKVERTEMLEWHLNESMLGNSYTGYYIVYTARMCETEKTFYALLDLTEFVSGKCEYKLLSTNSSLSEINSLLY